MNNSSAASEQQAKRANGTETLRLFCDRAADGDLERAAVILGRDKEELRQMLDGQMEVDDDLEMKMHGIAQERDFDIGSPAEGGL
jgi:hypothetical protein